MKMSNLKIMFLATGAAVTLISGNAYAGACDVNVEATATMAFNVKEIKVPKKCKEITLKLTNTGTMPKAIMGHNVVISKTSDIEEVNKNGMVAA